MKNYVTSLHNDTFLECRNRVPTGSRVHLLMTNEALKKHHGYKNDPMDKNMVVLRADVQDDILRLRYLTKDNYNKIAEITEHTTVIIVCECLSFSRSKDGFTLAGLRYAGAVDSSITDCPTDCLLIHSSFSNSICRPCNDSLESLNSLDV